MKQITYEEVVEIDGEKYTVSRCDCSQSIPELIKACLLYDTNQEVVN